MSTIVAISTAPGVGGIGIIRMSGEGCFEILEKIFIPRSKKKEKINGYTMKYGHIINKERNEVLDEVLVSYFVSPKSYTTENMCEINSHGSNVIMQKILELCLKNGATLAEPGEFTKRAFLNGRIDLSQAESVIDIINSKTEREAKASVNQLQGRLSQSIREIKGNFMDLMVDIEASIDYPEYDVEDVTNKRIEKTLIENEKKLFELEKNFDNGRIIKDGILTSIIGRPNAGKSSLLNALLGENRAIVTEYEGTTRDTIEEFVSIEGIPLKIIDTAGIRNAKDAVEKIGIEKAKKIANESDLVIAIFDSSKDLTEEDYQILDIIENKNAIIVLNKSDLPNRISEQDEKIKNTGKKVIKISAIKNDGISRIEKEIVNMYKLDKINMDNEIIVTNVRHRELIEKAIGEIEQAKVSLEKGMSVDIIGIHVKNILEALGGITGESVSDNIINEIFAKFCLGK